MRRGKRSRKQSAYEVARWWKELRGRNNETFLPLFFDEHRHLVLMGGGGSGKSVFAAMKVLERCSTEPGHRWLVVRKVARTLRESCFELLKSLAFKYYADAVEKIPKGKGSELYILFKNGSQIIFAGLDDVEKLKSIAGLSGIWIEEASEIDQDDFTQLDIRLRDEPINYHQIIITFNPISLTHWLKARFFDQADPEGRVRTHRSNYKDNRFCTEAERITLEAFKDSDPYHYEVYTLGNWGVLGKTVFDKVKLSARLQRLPKPVLVGGIEYDYDGSRISGWRLAEDRNGELKVYKMPEQGHPYVIGADTAGEGSDFFVAQVLDNSTGEQVAVYRTKTDEGVFARELYALGMIYNTALIGVETNFGTHPVKELERLSYPKQYLRQREDTIANKTVLSLGFQTNKLTRFAAIADLKDVVREAVHLINDETTIHEMLTFVKNEKTGRAEAEAGAHDDCVMALAIAHAIREQQTTAVTGKAKPPRAKWEQDMYEDYYAATPEEQRRLIEEWGDPF